MTAAPATSDPTAVIGRRVLAALVDGLLLSIGSVILWQSQAEFVRIPEGSEFGDTCEVLTQSPDYAVCAELFGRAYVQSTSDAILVWAISLVVGILYFVVLQGLTGRTLGKAITGLRTVREDGSVPGIGRAAARWVLLVIDSLPCIPLVGFITALTTKGHRRVGDMAAKTFVIRAAAAGSPVWVPGVTAPEHSQYAYGQQSWGPSAGPPHQAWEQPPGPPQQGWAEPSAAAQQGWAPPTSPPIGSEPPVEPAPGEEPAAPADEPAAQPPTAEPAAPPADEAAEVPVAPTPEEPAAAPPVDEPAPAATVSPEGPQWDEARGTYIQWDPGQRLWLQWDATTRTWSPIPGQ